MKRKNLDAQLCDCGVISVQPWPGRVVVTVHDANRLTHSWRDTFQDWTTVCQSWGCSSAFFQMRKKNPREGEELTQGYTVLCVVIYTGCPNLWEWGWLHSSLQRRKRGYRWVRGLMMSCGGGIWTRTSVFPNAPCCFTTSEQDTPSNPQPVCLLNLTKLRTPTHCSTTPGGGWGKEEGSSLCDAQPCRGAHMWPHRCIICSSWPGDSWTDHDVHPDPWGPQSMGAHVGRYAVGEVFTVRPMTESAAAPVKAQTMTSWNWVSRGQVGQLWP